jgi:hypothetical protein
MPDLEHALQGNDLGFLKIVASAWGIEMNAPDTVTALPILVEGIIEHADFAEVIEALPQDAKNVLQVLLQNEGKIPWATFVRKYGEVRRMGAARRDRERPDLRPASAVEVLWYRGLIARAILNPPPEGEPQEFAYIPDDLLALLPSLRSESPEPLGRPATPNESAHPLPATDKILDHACTLLAALRLRMDEDALKRLPLGDIPLEALRGLLRAAFLLDYDDLPHPEHTRAFLEAPRAKALAQLARAWMDDKHFNELRLLPGLKFEGEWINEPRRARQAVLELVGQIPENRWWSLSALISGIHDQQPDFQRPAGDYDSWFIRQESTGQYLRGFGTWEDVDGALVRFLILGPMHWLGMVNLAAPQKNAPPAALQLSRWAEALWHGAPPEGLAAEDGGVKVFPDGRVTVAAKAPRALRYQVARFCQWENSSEIDKTYIYRITPGALERARAQNLRPSQFAALLRRHSEGPLPPQLLQALDRWEQSGTQAVVEPVFLLRVTSAEILTALRKTRAGKYLGEVLNETTVIIRAGKESQVMSALAEIGYLTESKLQKPPADE